MLRQLVNDVHALVVLSFGVDDVHRLFFIDQHAAVARLSTHLAIERRIVEYQFVIAVFLLCHLSVAENPTFIFGVVVAHELLLSLLPAIGMFHADPVRTLFLGGVAGTLLLFLHFLVELLLIHRESVLTTNQLGEVEREAVGIEQTESLFAIERLDSFPFHFVHRLVEHRYSLVERTEEGFLLFLDDTADERLLRLQLGIGIAHFVDERRDEFEHECLFLFQERVCIADGTAQDASDDIARLCITGQLSVGNRERHGTQVVCHHAHRHVHAAIVLLLVFVFEPCQSFHLMDVGLENVGVVVRLLTLNGAHQSLESHARVNHVHRKFFERTVSLSVILHEDQVPYLNDLRVVLIDERPSRHLCFLRRRA